MGLYGEQTAAFSNEDTGKEQRSPMFKAAAFSACFAVLLLVSMMLGVDSKPGIACAVIAGVVGFVGLLWLIKMGKGAAKDAER